MAKKVAKRKKASLVEPDSAYLVKIFCYGLLGLLWVKINGQALIPVGLIIGLLASSQDRFRIDRKIEYVVLILTSFLAYFVWGIFLAVNL